MAVVRWTFFDPISSLEYEFAINPNEGGSISRSKSLTYQASAAADGSTIIMEGRDAPPTTSFSGVLLEQAQLEAFDLWYEKRHQVLLTDDLGRQYWIYITRFDPKRQRARSHPWKHSYSVDYVILDVA